MKNVKAPPSLNPPLQQDMDDKRHWLILYGTVIKELLDTNCACTSNVSAAIYYADRGLAAANERFNK